MNLASEKKSVILHPGTAADITENHDCRPTSPPRLRLISCGYQLQYSCNPLLDTLYQNDRAKKHAKCEDANLNRVREDLQNKVDLLRKQTESYDDKGPVIDAVVWHDGEVWRADLDTQSLQDEPECGKLVDFLPLTNYRIERKHGVFSKLDALTFVLNVYNEGNILSIVTDSSPHATHVAGIAAAYHPKERLLKGIAPGAQLISCKIGEKSVGSMETGTGLTRALIATVEGGLKLSKVVLWTFLREG